MREQQERSAQGDASSAARCLYVGPARQANELRIDELPPPSGRRVRVVLLSDTHQQLSSITVPPGDVLCHTGDISFCARGGVAVLGEFNSLLASLPHPHKLVIAGNHDRHLERLGREEAKRLLSAATYLENEGVHVCGLHFWGSPFSPRHKGSRSSNRAFQYSESRQRGVMRYIPRDVDVLLTHGSHGSAPLRDAVNRIQPLLHACGHDHELHGASLLEWPLPDHTPPSAGRPHRWRRLHADEAALHRQQQQQQQQQQQLLHQQVEQQQVEQQQVEGSHEGACGPHATPGSSTAGAGRSGRRRARSEEFAMQQADEAAGGEAVPGESAPPRRVRRGVHVNAAICNAKYQPVQLPVVIDLLPRRKGGVDPREGIRRLRKGSSKGGARGGGGGASRTAWGRAAAAGGC